MFESISIPETMQGLITIIVFIIPGLVWNKVYSFFLRSFFLPRREAGKEFFFIECIASSCFVYAILSLLIYIFILYGRYESVLLTILLILLVLLIFPAFCGYTVAKLVKEGIIETVIHPIPE